MLRKFDEEFPDEEDAVELTMEDLDKIVGGVGPPILKGKLDCPRGDHGGCKGNGNPHIEDEYTLDGAGF